MVSAELRATQRADEEVEIEDARRVAPADSVGILNICLFLVFI
jgi:hypothetical protein